MNPLLVGAIGLCLGLSSPALAEGRIDVCLDGHRNPVGERPGQATYNASITWAQPPGSSGHLVLGAYDTSHVVWVQRTFGTIHGTSAHDSVRFVVSDDSAYPLEFAVYRLNDTAFEDYRRACAEGDCHFSRNHPGVEILTNHFERPRPAQGATGDCG